MQIYQLLNQNSAVVEGLVLPLGVPEEVHVAQQPSLAHGQLCLSHILPLLPDVGQTHGCQPSNW